MPCFENVTYKYKAKDWCSYNCEMYLEFTISDPEQFRTYAAELTEAASSKVNPAAMVRRRLLMQPPQPKT